MFVSSRTIMKSKLQLTESDVQQVAQAAVAHAKSKGWAVSIAVVDDGGHLLWLQRLDGAAPISAHICVAKAHSAALGRRDSKGYEDMINQGRTAFLSVPTVQGLLEGGVPIVVQGDVVGAVGVSGVKAPEDAEVARAGATAIQA